MNSNFGPFPLMERVIPYMDIQPKLYTKISWELHIDMLWTFANDFKSFKASYSSIKIIVPLKQKFWNILSLNYINTPLDKYKNLICFDIFFSIKFYGDIELSRSWCQEYSSPCPKVLQICFISNKQHFLLN